MSHFFSHFTNHCVQFGKAEDSQLRANSLFSRLAARFFIDQPRKKRSPFTWNVKVHKFTSVVLHVYWLYWGSPTNLQEDIGPTTGIREACSFRNQARAAVSVRIVQCRNGLTATQICQLSLHWTKTGTITSDQSTDTSVYSTASQLAHQLACGANISAACGGSPPRQTPEIYARLPR